MSHLTTIVDHDRIRAVLCKRLDSRKQELHEADKDHLMDAHCNTLRNAIKDIFHPLRAGVEIELQGKPKKKKRKKKEKSKHRVKKQERKGFYESRAWRELRYFALKAADGLCALCGRGKKHGVVLHVDHIKPRSKHPELELDADNLQVLCEDCNLGKSNKDDTDWR